jgi:hypothetical protein
VGEEESRGEEENERQREKLNDEGLDEWRESA